MRNKAVLCLAIILALLSITGCEKALDSDSKISSDTKSNVLENTTEKANQFDSTEFSYTQTQITSVVDLQTEYFELPDGKIDKEYYEKAIYPNLFLKGIDPETVLLADDFDGDGLNLSEEYEYDTNPFKADSDDDGLNDYDEEKLYNTNSYCWDTDNDEMSDGTEVDCGLNPLINDSDSDGILDKEEIVTQKVRIESLNIIDIEKTLVKPEIEITGKGDFSSQIYAQDICYDKAITDINAVVGHPFDFVHEEDINFESSKLTFKISNYVLEDNKLEDLVIAYYNDNKNSIEILDTTCNSANNSISTHVNHYSKFFVLNYSEWFTGLRLPN